MCLVQQMNREQSWSKICLNFSFVHTIFVPCSTCKTSIQQMDQMSHRDYCASPGETEGLINSMCTDPCFQVKNRPWHAWMCVHIACGAILLVEMKQTVMCLLSSFDVVFWYCVDLLVFTTDIAVSWISLFDTKPFVIFCFVVMFFETQFERRTGDAIHFSLDKD